MIMKENTISLQVHNYDNIGRYRITLDCNATIEEIREWRKKAHESVKVNWDALPKDATHIVYYAELVDKQNCVWFASVYMHGQAYNEKDFDRLFATRRDIGYVGAIHKII